MEECVGAILVSREHVLLGKRAATDSYPDMWDVPGGHLEVGETRDQALERELIEEIGVRPRAWEWLTGRSRSDPNGDLQLHICRVTAWDGEPRNFAPDEHADIRWFDVDAACRLPLAHPGYPALFRVAVQGSAPDT